MAKSRYPLRAAFFADFSRSEAGALAVLRLNRVRHADEIEIDAGGMLRLLFANIDPACSRDFEDVDGAAAVSVPCPPAAVPLYVGVEMPVAVDAALRKLLVPDSGA